jgi:hypothetical protein
MGRLLFSPAAWRSISFIAVSLALLRVFGIDLVSLGFVITAWPIARRTVEVDLRVHRFITEVLGPVVAIGAAVNVLRLPRLTSALFEVKPPPLLMSILAREPARVLAESARLSLIVSPW